MLPACSVFGKSAERVLSEFRIYHNGAGGAGGRHVTPLVVQRETRNYSRLMPDKLNALLDRLKAHQSDLILAMAEHDGMPAGSALRQVAELENVIAAVEAVADEEASGAAQGL